LLFLFNMNHRNVKCRVHTLRRLKEGVGLNPMVSTLSTEGAYHKTLGIYTVVASPGSSKTLPAVQEVSRDEQSKNNNKKTRSMTISERTISETTGKEESKGRQGRTEHDNQRMTLPKR